MLAAIRLARPLLAGHGLESPFIVRFSQSLARRRQRLSQANVRSTTQRRGKSLQPFAVSDRCTIAITRSGHTSAVPVANFGP
jgi:hypothetical protein